MTLYYWITHSILLLPLVPPYEACLPPQLVDPLPAGTTVRLRENEPCMEPRSLASPVSFMQEVQKFSSHLRL